MAARNALKTWTCWLPRRRDSPMYANKIIHYSLLRFYVGLRLYDLAVLRNTMDKLPIYHKRPLQQRKQPNEQLVT